MDVLSGGEYRDLVNSLIADNVLPSPDNVSNILNKYENSTDWQDEIYRLAFGTDQNISLSGHAGKTPFRVSFGYTNENGTLKTSNFERFTLGASAAPKFLDDHLSVQINIKGIVNNNTFADGGAVGAAVFFDPTKPVYNGTDTFNGYWGWTSTFDGATGDPSKLSTLNPLGMLKEKYDTGKTKRSLGNIQIDYKMHFLPDLRANLNLGYDVAKGEGENGYKDGAFSNAINPNWPNIGTRSEWENRRKNSLLEFYLDYNHNFDAIKSNLDVMAGYSWQHFWKEDYSRTFTNKADKTIKEGWVYDDDAQRFEKDGDHKVPSENYLVSFFGRVNFSALNRYLITATLRRDGSSRFSDDNRWGLFPSVALAWTLSNEQFLSGAQDVLSNLKIRAGYGVTGQQDVKEEYVYIPQYAKGTDPAVQYLGTFLVKPSGYNKDLKWEETETWNIALDYGFLNQRINGSIELYKKKTSDLLNTVDAPAGTNFINQITANVGTMENKGVEFNINATAIDKDDFSWDLGFNITWNESKITKLTASEAANAEGLNVGDISSGTGVKIQKHMVGYTPYTFYTYRQVYDKNGKPIQNVFVDKNGDGQITEADRYLNHHASPDWFYGISSQWKYKQWDLGMNFHGSIGNYMFNDKMSGNSSLYTVFNGNANNLQNILSDAVDFNFRTANTAQQVYSDLFLENASFFKMDNVTLGYSFKKFFTDKIKGRVYASVKNVFTITDYSGQDPEFNSGIDDDLWARPQIYTLGLNLNF